LLKEAEACVQEGRFFDGVQKINACMEEFEKTACDSEAGELLKDPKAFGEQKSSTMSAENRAALASLHEVRGDMMVGLGANKRALVEFTCAEALGLSSPELVDKRRKLDGSAKKASDKVPCTILTGFLGSGKTTLLNHILRATHGKRIAVIENEFGEVGIDDSLVERSVETEENIVEMNNGCICCTVRGDLIAGLKKLVKKSIADKKPLDGVIIETTGLADPAPVAQTFFADDYVRQKMSLDGILTVVDAKHIIEHLNDEKPEGVENEAVEQLAFADRILLNKTDLVNEETLKEVESRIRAINEAVPIKRTQNSVCDMDYLLAIEAFSLDKVMQMDGGFLDNDASHEHDERVSSVGVDVAGEVDQAKLNKWIDWLIKENGTNLFRYKGVLAVKDMPDKFVFQGIHMIFTGNPQKPWAPDEEKRCKMIFIGKHLNREELTSGFMSCMVA